MVRSSSPVVRLVVSDCVWLLLVVSIVSGCVILHWIASFCVWLLPFISGCVEMHTVMVVVLSPYLLLLLAVSCCLLLHLIGPSCPICLVVSALQFDPVPSGCVQLVPGVSIYVWLFNGVYGWLPFETGYIRKPPLYLMILLHTLSLPTVVTVMRTWRK